jgi:hypothetical protein
MKVKNPQSSRKMTMKTYASGDVKYAAEFALGDGFDVGPTVHSEIWKL